MSTHKSRSNQWGLGLGLSRSTIYAGYRWTLWLTYGYSTVSISWARNTIFHPL